MSEEKSQSKKEKRPPIPNYVINALWAMSAGICEFEGCNHFLYEDMVTKQRLNQSNISHIIAWQPSGPRGDEKSSPRYATDITNLMLTCPEHNHLIDNKELEAEYPIERLRKMKKEHEDRVKRFASMMPDHISHVICYSRPIGDYFVQPSNNEMFTAMSSHFPASAQVFDLGSTNTALTDDNNLYWLVEQEELLRKFEPIKREIASGRIKHLSIFAIAPQPLLIMLGTLLLDLVPTEVYQKHREPATWSWQETMNPIEYKIESPKKSGVKVALNLSLSGNIDDTRIYSVLGDNTSVWKVSINQSNNDFMQDRDHLVRFRQTMRLLYDRIKLEHGQESQIHVFPACPASAAIEIGRVRMPKVDCPLAIYDQNKKTEGFTHTFDIE